MAPFALQSARLEAHLSTHAFKHLFTLLYACAVALMFIWGFKTEFCFPANGRIMRYYIGMARGAGYTLNLNVLLVILLAAKTFLTLLRETPLANILPLDTSFPDFHVIVGYVIGIAVLIHGAFHMVWITRYDGWAPGLWQINQSVITGFVLFAVFAAMFILSQRRIRQKYFRLFHITHILGASLFFPLLILHGMFRAEPYTYKWIVPGLIIYLFDRVVRRLRVHKAQLPLSLAESSIVHDNVMKLKIPRPFPFRAGQYAEVQVPAINKEWHPFSIASATHEEFLTFYVKQLGDWTEQLKSLMKQAEENGNSVKIHVRGPFGAPAQHARNYERVVLISGGIGATPFSSVCKDLHYRNTQQKRYFDSEDDDQVSTFQYEDRIRTAIRALYNVDIGTESTEDEERTRHKSIFLANMLHLTAGTAQDKEETKAMESTSSDDSNRASIDTAEDTSSESGVEVYAGTEDDSDEYPRPPMKEHSRNKTMSGVVGGKQKARSDIIEDISKSASARSHTRQRMLGLYQSRAKLLDFLHTTRVIFLLLVMLLARIVIVCVGSILNSEFVLLSEAADKIETAKWVVYADTSLGIILAIVLPLTIGLEISFMGFRYFRTAGRCVDFFFFAPLTILCALMGIRTWITNEPEHEVMAFLHYVVFLPTLFILLAARMYRSIGSGRLLADGKCKCELHCTIPDVDFIWTVPNEEDDQWLRDDLEPLATGTELRLHRYVTRTKEIDVEAQPEFVSSAHAGRPDWDELFGNVALSAPSNSRVGVFFCGPHKMGDAVQKALRRAEINSNLRGAYLKSTREEVLAHDLGLRRRSVLQGLRERGCGVRFVLREENFG